MSRGSLVKNICQADPMAALPTPLLLSKLRPHGISGRSLRRDALVEELISSGDKATLIAAPAGSGKTTLMEQMHQELCLRGVPTSWLTFDSNDTDAQELVQYLVRALLEAGIVDASGEETARNALDSRSPRASLARFFGRAGRTRQLARGVSRRCSPSGVSDMPIAHQNAARRLDQ